VVTEEPAQRQPDHDATENVRIGYQKALDLWICQTGVVENRVNSLILSNSVFAGAIILLFTTQHQSLLLAFFPCLIGISMNIVWYAYMTRGFDRAEYYVYCARELEERHLSDQVALVGNGGDRHADGDPVSVFIDGRWRDIQIRRWGRRRARDFVN